MNNTDEKPFEIRRPCPIFILYEPSWHAETSARNTVSRDAPGTAVRFHALPNGMRPLDPAIKTVWMIKLALGWTVLILAAVTYDVLGFFKPDRWLPFGALTALALLVGVTAVIVLPRLRYRFWRFDLRPEELYLERGIWNRVRTIVPLRRIQHLDVSQDVLERNFELGKLIVHTAGTRSSDVVLPGLRYEEAERLRDEVKHYITEDAV